MHVPVEHHVADDQYRYVEHWLEILFSHGAKMATQERYVRWKWPISDMIVQ
jgi:hypothetical protein